MLSLYCLAAGGVAAQQLYKSVGPDGKVTYTDRPPSGEASAKVSVMKSYVMRPVEAPPPPSLSSNLPVPAGDAAKKAAADAAASAKTGMSIEVEQAVAGVLGLEDLFRRSEAICTRSAPPASRRYAVSLSKWRERNASFLKKEQKILMEVFSPTLRAALQVALNEKNDRVLNPVASALPTVRVNWCDKGFDDLDSGMHDIANNPALSIPLISFTAR